MANKFENKERHGDLNPSIKAPRAESRAGSNAGRGFRYQDAVSAWLAVEIWSGQRVSAIVIPEGGDDVELRGEETTFVQIKSRREHLGKYSEGETTSYIEDLWRRSLGSSSRPERLELILERDVSGLTMPEGNSVLLVMGSSICARLSSFGGVSNLLPKTSIIVVSSPQECAISLIVERIGCAPIAAQMCFAELLVRVGALADANGRLLPENYRGMSASDTESSIRNVLTVVDPDAIEYALKEGVCEPVDFLTPLNDPSFYLGIDVEPGHIAAGLVSEQPLSRSLLIKGIEQRRAALIIGPSGAGKSALMWETASKLRHTVRWFRIRRLNEADISSVRQLIRTFRAAEDSPLGFVMDDIGRSGPESWGTLLKEVMSVPGVVMLGSIREEDVPLIAERARAVEIRIAPDDELAERLWQELLEAGKTLWKGWREPWNMSEGLLLEYVHILTSGQRMHELLADQVATRISDPKRALELDILRCGAWAGAASARIDSARLALALAVNHADLSRSLKRLFQEHLILSPAPGAITGLHQLRSVELLRLTHETALPTLETTFKWTVASVPAVDLEPLIAYAISVLRLPVKTVLNSLIIRLEKEPDIWALAAAFRGLGSGRVGLCVDEWLDSPEVCALPRTQVGTAAQFGVAEIDLSALDAIPAIQAAADLLSKIKGKPKDDPRHLLMELMPPSLLSVLIHTADLASLDTILMALVGMPLSTAIREALIQVPENLPSADLHLLGSLLGSLCALDRDIAIRWVSEVGQEMLLTRVQAEIAWAGGVIIEEVANKLLVRCNLWYVASSIQEDPHNAVVRLCELILALCPKADMASSDAVTVSGELAGLTQLPLANKRILRENLPPPSIPRWNRRWLDLISRRIASPSYSDYLSKGMAILELLVMTLEQLFEIYFRGKNVPVEIFETLNSLNEKIEALTSPSISPLDASGVGSGEKNTAVTRFQNLLHGACVNLIQRFAILPAQAGAYIGSLNGLLTDVDKVVTEEPWELIGYKPEPVLTRLKTLLETLRLLAGEAHERQEQPLATWSVRGKGARAGNAIKVINFSAKAEGRKRLAKREAEIELLAKKSDSAAKIYFRVNPERILPWPPADVLALLPATDIAGAAIVVSERTELVESLLDSSTHLTIMPSINGVALPALAISGYRSLLPDIKGATAWAEELGLMLAPSAVTRLFGEVISLAGELSAMNQIGLGTETRPQEEVAAFRNLDALFVIKYGELTIQLDYLDKSLQTVISELIECLLIGNTDLAAQAQAAIVGAPSDIFEVVGQLYLLLMEMELQIRD